MTRTTGLRRTLSLFSLVGVCACGTALAAAPAATPTAGAPAATAPAQRAAPQKITEVEGITEYRLANGLTVLLFPDQSKPTITVNVTYRVGSRQENYGETGMAHLLEHMMFKGTPRHPNIGQGFNARGMRFNGTTSLDRTNYFELFQANADNLDWALQMEADRMVNSLIARKDLDTEMTVVRNEYERGENTPYGVLLKRLQSVAYDWHNYAHATIGNRSDIENVAIGNLQAYYRMYYQPDNAVLLVAGKFDATQTLHTIVSDFGAIPKPKRQLPKLWTVEPTQDGERFFTVRRVGDQQIVALGYKTPSGVNPESGALNFAGQILGGTAAARLHKALVETGKAVAVTAFQQRGLDSSLQVVAAFVKKGDPIEPVQAEMTRLVEDFHKEPPTAAEMERTRTRLANQAEHILDDQENIGLQLSEFIALGDWRLFFLNRDLAAKMTADEVQAAAGKYYRRDNRTTGVFVPEDQPQRAEIPAALTAAEALKDFKPKQATLVAEAFDPGTDNIDSRTKRLEIKGIKVALLQKKTRGETVFVDFRLPSGDEKSLFGQRVAEQVTGQMLMRGTSKYTRVQLEDELARLKVAGGVGNLSGGFQTTRANVVPAIGLIAHVLREPAFAPTEFEQLKKLLATSIESQLNVPNAVASSALAQQFNIYPKGDVRYSPSLQESLDDINAVTLDDVKRFYKTFYGAERAQIAIVGDFDADEVIKAITAGLADWHSGTAYTRVTSQYKDIAPIERSIETPDKENAVLLARINLDINDEDADYPAMFLANYMLGGGAGFESRLVARIRVKEGLSYSVGSAFVVGRFDRAGRWIVEATAAPQNIDKVEAAFKDELAKVLQDGFTPEQVTAAKSGVLQVALQARAQDQRLAGDLLAHIDNGRTFAWVKQFEARVAALTPEEVLAVTRKYLDPAKISIVKAGDFSKVAKAKDEQH